MSTFITPIQPMERMTFSPTEQQETAPQGGVTVPFASVLGEAIAGVEQTQSASEALTEALVLGDLDNIAQLQIDSQKAEVMLQTAVQLTTRAVNAYKEIMQMQV